MDLKRFRQEIKVNQSEIADLFGVTQGHISNIEKGERCLTKLQYRLLIEKYGIEIVSKYADESELPNITINMPNNKIQGNSAPVQNGDGNSMSADPALIETINKLIEQNAKKDDQIDRLIALMEKLHG